MRIKKYGPPFLPAGVIVRGGPVYQNSLNSQQVAVAATPGITVLWTNATVSGSPPKVVYAMMRNSSSGGQIIRVGVAPSFTAPLGGLPLMPGDTLEVRDIVPSWLSMANSAGAVLDIESYITA